jgi:hypothetical protein
MDDNLSSNIYSAASTGASWSTAPCFSTPATPTAFQIRDSTSAQCIAHPTEVDRAAVTMAACNSSDATQQWVTDRANPNIYRSAASGRALVVDSGRSTMELFPIGATATAAIQGGDATWSTVLANMGGKWYLPYTNNQNCMQAQSGNVASNVPCASATSNWSTGAFSN